MFKITNIKYVLKYFEDNESKRSEAKKILKNVLTFYIFTKENSDNIYAGAHFTKLIEMNAYIRLKSFNIFLELREIFTFNS